MTLASIQSSEVIPTQYDPAKTFVHDPDITTQYGIYGAVAATIGPGRNFITRVLYDGYPEINAIGLCHEVLGTRH